MKQVDAGKHLFGVSLVGLDDELLFPRARELSRIYPFVTWGVLVHSDGGRDRKFASVSLLEAVANLTQSSPSMSFALHLCGPRLGALLSDPVALDRLHFSCFGVVQVSLREREFQLEQALRPVMRQNPQTLFVVQDTEDMGRWWSDLVGEQNLRILVDDSLGRGKSPAQWRTVHNGTGAVGYAGGLRTENLLSQLHNIAQVADRAFWIDIQSGLRDEGDRFSMQRAQELLRLCQAWIESHASGGSLAGSDLRL